MQAQLLTEISSEAEAKYIIGNGRSCSGAVLTSGTPQTIIAFCKPKAVVKQLTFQSSKNVDEEANYVTLFHLRTKILSEDHKTIAK